MARAPRRIGLVILPPGLSGGMLRQRSRAAASIMNNDIPSIDSQTDDNA